MEKKNKKKLQISWKGDLLCIYVDLDWDVNLRINIWLHFSRLFAFVLAADLGESGRFSRAERRCRAEPRIWERFPLLI